MSIPHVPDGDLMSKQYPVKSRSLHRYTLTVVLFSTEAAIESGDAMAAAEEKAKREARAEMMVKECILEF